MDAKDFAQLARDEQGNFLTITHDHYVYYAHTAMTATMNNMFCDIFARVYVHIHSDYFLDENFSLKNQDISPTVISDTHISIDPGNLIAERHDGTRISMTWSEWGDIQVI